MKVKNGIASSSSFDRMPNTRSGRLDMYWAGKKPRWIDTSPEASPSAASEKATGKPISITKTRLANMSGAMFSIVIIAAVARSACPSGRRRAGTRSA
jgi:hypothetical protein